MASAAGESLGEFFTSISKSASRRATRRTYALYWGRGRGWWQGYGKFKFAPMGCGWLRDLCMMNGRGSMGGRKSGSRNVSASWSLGYDVGIESIGELAGGHGISEVRKRLS